jgi:hypothetical protein
MTDDNLDALTTLALGEEVTSLAFGEEVTTQALGEENPSTTTYGEESAVRSVEQATQRGGPFGAY